MPDSVQPFTIHDVPGGLPLLGQLRRFKQGPLNIMSTWWRQHGDALRFKLGPKTLYLFSHPDLAEEILVQQSDRFVKVYEHQRPVGLALVLGNGLVTSSGEAWRRHRRIMQPVFHRSRVASMADRMVQVGEQRLESWADYGERPVDIAKEMMKLALEVISQTMFTTSVAEHMDQISHALRVSLKYAFDSFHNPLRPPMWVPTPRNREFRAVMQFLDTLVYGLLAERRRSGEKHDDLLDLLIKARDEETGATLSDQELRDETLTIFAAGHETTANALAWTWYLLATHPEAKARFHEELDRVLQGRTPKADDLQHLPYTRAVFDESLRLYPPVPAIQRRRRHAPSLEDYRSRLAQSFSSARTTCTAIPRSGAIPTALFLSDGWTAANGRLHGAPISHSAPDPGPAWGCTLRQWKGRCSWRLLVAGTT